jgi:hypothetical protein
LEKEEDPRGRILLSEEQKAGKRERDSRYTVKYSGDLQKTSVASETDLCGGEGGGGSSFTVWPKFKALFCYFYRIEDVPQTNLYTQAVTRCGTQGVGFNKNSVATEF